MKYFLIFFLFNFVRSEDVRYTLTGQSPIDLKDEFAGKVDSFPCLQWINYDSLGKLNVFYGNNTVEFELEMEKKNEIPLLRGGRLQGSYTPHAGHFHWGSSEHSVNGIKYPLEMHIVHYNTKYRNVREAQASKDPEAIVVVAVLFEVRKDRNPDSGFTKIMNKLERIQKKLATTLETASYRSFGLGFQNYYTYRGSLTTPPYSEIVRWVVSRNVRPITEKMLSNFPKVFIGGKQITQNFRPVQTVNNRRIQNIIHCTY